MINQLDQMQISQFFPTYFGQDYDLFTDIDNTKPLIPQIVQSYKNDCASNTFKRTVIELEGLIAQKYSETVLEEQVFLELGIDIDVNAFGYTHQQFLIEVLNILKE